MASESTARIGQPLQKEEKEQATGTKDPGEAQPPEALAKVLVTQKRLVANHAELVALQERLVATIRETREEIRAAYRVLAGGDSKPKKEGKA